jgi:hypothetical protein
MTDHPLLKSLSDIGITISIQDDRLRLTGNLPELTDSMKGDLKREKAAIMAALSIPYPNHEGLVKCVYCLSYRDHRCIRGREPDGISLLRDCPDFRFDQAGYDAFYSRSLQERRKP